MVDSQAHAPQRWSLLIVEDHRQAREGLVDLLAEVWPALQVQAVATAEEAFGRCRADPPDGVLLDYRLPGSDGVDVIERLRQLAPATAVVVLTADPNRSVQAAVSQAGAAACVGKSGDFHVLLDTIRTALDRPDQG